MSDLWDDPETRAYVTHVRTELVPKIEGSSIGISIVPTNSKDVDVKFAVELGLLIMLDKPIIAVVDPTTIIPERLRRVVDAFVIGDLTDPATQAELTEAIKRVGGPT